MLLFRLHSAVICAALGLAACSYGGQPENTAASETHTAAPSRALLSEPSLTVSDNRPVDFSRLTPPADLAADLQRGGYVIVFRYTGSGGGFSPIPAALHDQIKDDGQRISERSIGLMRAYGEQFRRLGIPVGRVLSSEYYFVWQHAQAAFGEPIAINRDLTGSLDFGNADELAQSLQNLRNRTATPPAAGSNTVLFTHQGKFDKAYGFYPPDGTTILFKPDGSGRANPVAVLSYEAFMALH